MTSVLAAIGLANAAVTLVFAATSVAPEAALS
jgi:hypothetical protein